MRAEVGIGREFAKQATRKEVYRYVKCVYIYVYRCMYIYIYIDICIYLYIWA